MTGHADFLVELGTEELPPKALKSLSEAFRSHIENALHELTMEMAGVKAYASPRRLAVLVEKLAERQPNQTIERRGPAVRAAFDDDGNPTPAALGFARSCGVDLSDLERLSTDKGEWLSHTAAVGGKPAIELLPRIVEQALAALPIPKRMRWGSGTHEFVRPVHWLLMLYGDQCIDAEILGVHSGRITYGHRYHSAAPIEIDSPESYEHKLESKGRVIADFSDRRTRICELAEDCARQNNGRAVIDLNLLDEVTGLVEWPVPICGTFDTHFLELPREVLVATMQGHQKYFPTEDEQGRLTDKFITISNLESLEPEAIRRGNERVIRPRLADAAFFWNKDRQTRLADRAADLAGIVFERRLGSLYDKTARVAKLARFIAPSFSADVDEANRAATLSRCDLVTEMVGEFPELQGVMGSYYARDDGESDAVSVALAEFYKPRFSGDTIPVTAIGQTISVADKIDTLVGIFSIGAEPTGDKDPYALRRAALGVIRIIVEGRADLDLAATLERACLSYEDKLAVHDVAARVFSFTIERLRGYYSDLGIEPDVIDAVLARKPTNPLDIDRRIKAVRSFRQMPEAQALAIANKRIANILKKSAEGKVDEIDFGLLADPIERSLAEKLAALEQEIQPLLDHCEYSVYLERLASLRDTVDRFFDSVMVMCDDDAVRRNRLALLTRMHDLFTRIADIARLNS